MKADLREIILCHRKDKLRVGHKDVAAVAVECHELVFALFECLECGFVVALYPACLVHRHRFPATLCAVFMEKAILDYLELQLSDGAYDTSAVELVVEQLRHAFVHQLLDALIELLRLHGIGVLKVHEQLR